MCRIANNIDLYNRQICLLTIPFSEAYVASFLNGSQKFLEAKPAQNVLKQMTNTP